MFPSPDTLNSGPAVARRVLIVDDEPTLRIGFAYALTSADTHVETAGTGKQALEKLSSDNFDIIILDLRMPEIDGLGVVERLRRDGSRVPVVLCTAALTPAAALRAIQCHVVDFLLKPVRPADLRSVIQFVLEPGSGLHDRAMVAARCGNFTESIALFTQAGRADVRSARWLEILRLIQEDGEDLEETAARRLDRGGLSALAYRAPL